MVKCVFCGDEEIPIRGVHLITNDGTVSYYCSSKCRKNALKLNRDKRKLKWTESYRIARDKLRHTHAKNASKPAKAKAA